MNEEPLEELEALLLKHADAGLTESERTRLNTILAEHPEARRLYAREQLLDTALHLEGAAGLDGGMGNLQHSRPDGARRTFWTRLEHLGIAALLVLSLTMMFLLWKKERPTGTWGDAVAKIEFLSDDARFGADHQLPRTPGSHLGKGWVQLEQGHIRLLFRSGASVEVKGPAALGIDTALRAYLDFGGVEVYAPESARDFTISTDSMEVVDLGTRFQVDVDPQSRESEVSVIEGLVDLHLGNRGAERMIQPLKAGYAARVDAFGKMVEITHEVGARPTNVADGPRIMAHWTFDGWSADGKVEDSTGNGLNGMLRAVQPPELVPGLSGQAKSFMGAESVDLREHLAALGQLEAFTLSAWVRDPGKPLAMIFSLSGDSEKHRVQFYLTRWHVRFGWQDGLHFDSISGQVDGWNPGQWYHVAATVAGGVVRLYRDGEMLASGSSGFKIGTPVSNPSLVKNASHAYIGQLTDGRQGEESAPQWFEGQMDDVQFYSGALRQEAIQFVFEHPGKTWASESIKSYE